MQSVEALPFDISAVIVVFVYICALMIIAFVCRIQNKGDTPEKFFLANRGLGLIVVIFTLYATQYSANTLLGFTGRTYRVGFSWLLTIQFFIAVIIFYLLYIPKLQKLAVKYRFITPNDYLMYRFGSKALVLIASVVMLVAMCNFLTAQLMAMGRILEGLVGPNFPEIDFYFYGAIFLAIIMVLYETIGGMLAVAWTDLIQGVILLVSFIILLFMTTQMYGGLSEASQLLQKRDEISALKLAVPNALGIREWISFILLMGLGAALYPQAIQRAYAAKSSKILYVGFACMLFFPFISALIAVVVGIIGAAYVSGLSGAQADQIVPVLMSQVMQSSTFGYWFVAIMFAGILAAMMSTADSLLLSISSVVTIDIYRGILNPQATDKQLARMGKILSWVLMAFLVWVAIQLRDTTLVKLLERKFDLLVQLAPAFLLGINWPSLKVKPVIWGLLIGLVIALFLAFCVNGKIWGFHAGLYALVVNFIIAIGASLLQQDRHTVNG